MDKKSTRSKKMKENILRTAKQLTPKHVDMFRSLIRTLIGGMIGVTLIMLFFIVVIAVVVAALLSEQSQRLQLLNTALTIIGPAIGTVFAYFLARETKRSST